MRMSATWRATSFPAATTNHEPETGKLSNNTGRAETLIAEILDAACPNGGTDENGNNIYVIETHCVAWQITAKKIGGRWHIIKSEPEPC